MTQFQFTELTEKKIHVKQNMKNSNKKMLRYLIVCLSVINTGDITKGQSKMDNPEKLTNADDKQKQTQHNMCLTPLSANKHNQRK